MRKNYFVNEDSGFFIKEQNKPAPANVMPMSGALKIRDMRTH